MGCSSNKEAKAPGDRRLHASSPSEMDRLAAMGFNAAAAANVLRLLDGSVDAAFASVEHSPSSGSPLHTTPKASHGYFGAKQMKSAFKLRNVTGDYRYEAEYQVPVFCCLVPASRHGVTLESIRKDFHMVPVAIEQDVADFTVPDTRCVATGEKLWFGLGGETRNDATIASPKGITSEAVEGLTSFLGGVEAFPAHDLKIGQLPVLGVVPTRLCIRDPSAVATLCADTLREKGITVCGVKADVRVTFFPRHQSLSGNETILVPTSCSSRLIEHLMSKR